MDLGSDARTFVLIQSELCASQFCSHRELGSVFVDLKKSIPNLLVISFSRSPGCTSGSCREERERQWLQGERAGDTADPVPDPKLYRLPPELIVLQWTSD